MSIANRYGLLRTPMSTCQAVGTLLSYRQTTFINMNIVTGTDIFTNAAVYAKRSIAANSKPFFSQPL